jgi:hypothetical protein
MGRLSSKLIDFGMFPSTGAVIPMVARPEDSPVALGLRARLPYAYGRRWDRFLLP